MRRLLLAIILIEIPLRLDMYLHHDEAVAAQGAISGFNVSLTTICLALLYAMSWPGMLVRPPFDAPPWRSQSLPLVCFFFVVALSTLVAGDRSLAFFEVFLLLQTLLLYLYVVYWVRTRQDVLFVVSVLMAGLLLQGALMVAVRVLDSEISLGTITARINRNARVEGTLGSPNNAASYLTLVLAPALGLLVSRVPRRFKWLAAGALGFGTVALMLTESRGGWVAFVVSCGLFCALAWRRGWLSLAVPTAIAAAVAVMVFAFQDTFFSRLLVDDGGSAAGRFPLIGLTLQMIADHPLLGVGANNCALAAEDYTNTVTLRSAWLYTVHNKYLLVWVEGGILGLTAFVWFLAATLRRGWLAGKSGDRVLAPLGLAFTAAMVGQMVHMHVDMFHSRSQVQFFWLTAAIVTAIYNVSRSEAREGDVVGDTLDGDALDGGHDQP